MMTMMGGSGGMSSGLDMAMNGIGMSGMNGIK